MSVFLGFMSVLQLAGGLMLVFATPSTAIDLAIGAMLISFSFLTMGLSSLIVRAAELMKKLEADHHQRQPETNRR